MSLSADRRPGAEDRGEYREAAGAGAIPYEALGLSGPETLS